jgi:hypothetical protein
MLQIENCQFDIKVVVKWFSFVVILYRNTYFFISYVNAYAARTFENLFLETTSVLMLS